MPPNRERRFFMIPQWRTTMATSYIMNDLPESSFYTSVFCGPKFSLLCLYLLKWPLEWTKAADKLESIVTSNISLHPQYSSPLLIVADLAQRSSAQERFRLAVVKLSMNWRHEAEKNKCRHLCSWLDQPNPCIQGRGNKLWMNWTKGTVLSLCFELWDRRDKMASAGEDTFVIVKSLTEF